MSRTLEDILIDYHDWIVVEVENRGNQDTFKYHKALDVETAKAKQEILALLPEKKHTKGGFEWIYQYR